MNNLIDAIVLFNKCSTDFYIQHFLHNGTLNLYIYDLGNDQCWHLESHYDKDYSIKELIIFLNKLCYRLRGE